MPARILIIEDTPHNLELMRYLLEARGHSLAAATNGSDGVALAQDGALDLVILDLQLGDATGFEVLEKIRLFPQIAGVPIIAVTAFAMVGDRDKVPLLFHSATATPDDLRRIEALGAKFLGRPVDPAVLLETIRTILGETVPQQAEDR